MTSYYFFQEVELLTNSINQLQSARNKYQESNDCIEKQKEVKEGAEVLVPLTGSMYVPGTIVNTKKFIVDIGTGYYVQKDYETALDFFKRKVTFLQEQMEKYVKILQEKAALRDSESHFLCLDRCLALSIIVGNWQTEKRTPFVSFQI